jgi:hypothetical protein
LVPDPKDTMTSPCIHGFRTDECAACRACPHGLVTSQCGRCIRASSTPAGRKALISAVHSYPSEERAGFEIFYEPAMSGWRFRAEQSAPSVESYRSLFLARKAVDQVAAAAAAAPASTKRHPKET